MCEACRQPRPGPGSHPSRLGVGEREYRGYEEWAVHPDEAHLVLERGYAIVDGQRADVLFIHNEAYVTQIRVYGSDVTYSLEANYWASPGKEHVAV
jgi:hypothetical protein